MYVTSVSPREDSLAHRQRIPKISEVPLELLRHLALRVRNNRTDQRVVVIHEPVPLPSLRNTLALLAQESLVLLPQSAQTAGNGLVVTGFAA